MSSPIILGAFLGITITFVYYLQMKGRWKNWGFVRAKSAKEKERVKSYNSKSIGKVKQWQSSIILLVILGFFGDIFIFKLPLENLFAGVLSSLITLFISFIALVFIMDTVIRKKH